MQAPEYYTLFEPVRRTMTIVKRDKSMNTPYTVCVQGLLIQYFVGSFPYIHYS